MRSFVALTVLFTFLAVHAGSNVHAFPVSCGVPSAQKVSLAGITLNPYVQIGYQEVSANSSLPILYQTVIPVDNQLQVGTMEIMMKKIGFWSGTIGIGAELTPRVSISASAMGYLPPPSYPIETSLPIGLNGVVTPGDINFRATKTEYWLAQIGGSFNVTSGGSVLFGFLWDHFGNLAVEPIMGSQPFPDQTLRADFWSKTAIPFLGVGLKDRGLTTSFIYSPLAYSRSLMALRNSLGGLTELDYKFHKPGQLFSVNAAYDIKLPDPLFVMQVWGMVSWMAIRGTGDFDYTFTSNVLSVSLSGSAPDATSSKYVLGVGGTFGVVF